MEGTEVEVQEETVTPGTLGEKHQIVGIGDVVRQTKVVGLVVVELVEVEEEEVVDEVEKLDEVKELLSVVDEAVSVDDAVSEESVDEAVVESVVAVSVVVDASAELGAVVLGIFDCVDVATELLAEVLTVVLDFCCLFFKSPAAASPNFC